MNVMGLMNEDGTPTVDFLTNPLQDKWEVLYPPVPKVQYSQVCDGYSCMWCGRCPRGEHWVVPDEDKELWDKYQKEIDEYNKIHNPSLYALKHSTLDADIKQLIDKLFGD